MFKIWGRRKEFLDKPSVTLGCVFVIVLLTVIFSYSLPEDPADFGAVSLFPAVFLIFYIFTTQRILEALTLASFIGFIMVSRPADMIAGGGFLPNALDWLISVLSNFSSALLAILMSEDIAYLLIVCGLMGGIIVLIEKTGGAQAFAEWIAKFAKTRKSALLCSWILGIIICIDDYLDALTASCMVPLTDKHKVPREFLAYVVDSTAAPLCVLIPISTWAVFCARILESSGWAPADEGITYFIKTIPFNFYGWIAAIAVPLFILQIIPEFGPMKKAEDRVRNGGPLAPPGSEKIDMHAGSDLSHVPEGGTMWNLFLPIGVLIASTVYFDVDIQMGVLFTLIFMFFYLIGQGLISAEEFFDCILQGIKNMLLPIMLMILAFQFKEVNDAIHFTEFVINSALGIMTPQLMPLTVFILLAITEFITGTNWGMYVIALPIVVPLSVALGANTTLVVAAVLSAGVFGSHICFYSDATVITSASTGCNNFDHAMTQAPYGIMCAVISAVMYLIAGFIF